MAVIVDQCYYFSEFPTCFSFFIFLKWILKSQPNNGSKEAQEVLDSVASYSEKEHGVITSKNTSKEELIEVEDNDDYLMYLEDILKTIHKAYYELYDQVSTLLDALVCRFLAWSNLGLVSAQSG